MKDTDQNNKRHDGAPGLEQGKRWALLASLAMIGAVWWPLQENWRKDPRDSFPLSYYPMFSSKRKPIESFNYLVGHDAEGKRYLVRYSFASEGGLNSVRRQINRMVKEDRADAIARRVAKRLAERDSGKWSKIVSVAVVTGKYSVDDYFHGRKEPVSEKIRASAPVERNRREAD